MPRHTLVAPDVPPQGLVEVVDSSPALAIQAGDSLRALLASSTPRDDSVVSLSYAPSRLARGAPRVTTPTVAQPLPGPISDLLVSVLTAIAGGHGVTVIRTGSDLSTSQAATLLGCSRPHVAKLLAHGVIPSYPVGTHRRITLADALAYRRAREKQAAGLTELATLSAMFPPDGPPSAAADSHTGRTPKKSRRSARAAR